MDAAPEGGALTLLVVEDDARTREELARILERRTDLRVVCAATPGEALALPPPDLALLDIRLPGMGGLELLPRLKERSPDLLAIVMTGYGEASTAREAREHGAVDFLEKPLDLAYLLVTLRQQAREARLRRDLRHSSQLFRRVVEGLPDGLVLADVSERVLYGNTLGKALWESGARTSGGTVDHAGRTYLAERSASGDRVLWRYLDLTSALEEERLRNYRRMARLLAHEIHNPLTPMRLWLQELKAAAPGDPSREALVREATAVLLEQVERLAGLAGRFRDLAEDRPLALRPVAAGPAAASALQSLRPLAEQAGVFLAQEVAEGLAVEADEGALHQLLFNLVRNAVEAQAGRGGTGRLRGAPDGARVILEVVDAGGGLPPEVAAAPFTPYLTTKEGGTGLGLLVCRELARRMGGELELEDRPGRGVTARVRLRACP